MENMLKVIVETDKASRLDVQKAVLRREELTNELAKTKEKIDSEYKRKAEEKVENLKKSAEKEVAEIKEKIKLETYEKSKALTKNYEENHEEWENSIFNAVTGK